MNFNPDSNDILGVLNANTDTSLMEGMKEDIKAANKFNIQLSKDQANARSVGYTQSSLGVTRVADTPTTFRKRTKQWATDEDTASTNYDNELEISPADTLHNKELYKKLLGESAYSELKHKVGLQDTDSFTDYYNRTGYIPAGYEMEARLALAEEKRINLYMKYEEGTLSETDFLYQAYGKDLMKESGHDLDSTLYWYNRHKNGDYSSILDSDTFLSDLIANARNLWQEETWYRDKSTKTLSSSLAGVVTGQTLSTESVYNLFKEQFDALDEFFDDDHKKIITYYQAGALDSNTFKPFVDIDNDGYYDYYYHMDGKLYAVDGKNSKGEGKHKAKVEYTKDVNGDLVVHSVSTINGPEWLTGLGQGLLNFVTGFVDLGYLAFNGVTSIFSDGFVDRQQEYEAFKARTGLGGEDSIVMDGSSQWNAYNVSKAIGEITGMIAMAVLTSGASAAADSANLAGKSATLIDDIAKLGTNYIDDIAKVTVSSLDDLSGMTAKQVVKTLQRDGVDKAVIDNVIKKGLVKTATGQTYQLAGHGIKHAAGQVISKGILKPSQAVLGTLSRAKMGQGFGAGLWTQAVTSSSILAVQDFASTYATLSAANKGLRYLESIDPENFRALDEGDIFFRAGATAATDLAISTFFRLSGSDGLTTKIKSLSNASKAVSQVDEKKLLTFFKSLNQPAQSSINNLSKHLVRNTIIDNIADSVENILTAGVSIAANNIYEDFDLSNMVQQTAKGMGSVLTSPSGALMNAYIAGKNFVSISGNSFKNAVWGESTLDQRKNTILHSYALAGEKMDSLMSRLSVEATTLRQSGDVDSINRAQALENLINHYNKQANNSSKSKLANQIEFIVEFDKTIGNNASEDDIKHFLGLPDTPEGTKEAKQIKDIMTKFVGKDGEFGVFSAYVLNNAKVKNVEETFKAYEETFNNVYTIANATKDAYTKLFRGELHSDNINEIFDNPNDWRFKQIDKFIKTFNSISDNMGYKQNLTMQSIKKQLFGNKVAKLQQAALDFDKLFTMDTFCKESFFDEIKFKYDETTGTLKIVSRESKKRDETLNKFKEHSNPLVKMFANPAENKEAIKALIDTGAIYIDNNGHIIINDTSKSPILGVITFKPEMTNTVRDKDTEEAKLYAIYEAIADLGLAKDEDGDPITSDNFLTKISIKDPNGTNGSGETPTHTVFVIHNKVGANFIELFNTPERLHTTINSLYHLSNSTDEATLQAAALNLVQALYRTDDDLSSMTDEEKKAKIQEQTNNITSLILTMSDSMGEIKKSSALFNRSRLIYLYLKGLLPDESLDAIANDKALLGISIKARNEARQLKEYINSHDKVAEVKNIFIELAKLKDSGVDAKPSTKQQKQIKDFILYMKDPKNVLIKEALKEDGHLNSDLLNFIDNTSTFLPFYERLEKMGLSLTDIENAGLSSINEDGSEAALKNFLVKFLNEAQLETFMQSYTNVYEGMRDEVIDITYTNIKDIQDSKKETYEELQKFASKIKAAKESRDTSEAKALLDYWFQIAEEFKYTTDYQQELIKEEHKDLRKGKHYFNYITGLTYEEARILMNVMKKDLKALYDYKTFTVELLDVLKNTPIIDTNKTLRKLLFSLNDVELRSFFKNTDGWLEDLRQDLIMSDPSKETDINNLIKELSSNVDSNKLMTLYFDNLDDNIRENLILKYLTVAEGSNKILEGKVYKDTNGDWIYEDDNKIELVTDVLLKSDITSAAIVLEQDTEELANDIIKIVKNYDTFIKEGTVYKQAKNTLEINVLDLLPKEYGKLLTIYRNSVDAKNNHNSILEKDLERELAGILDGGTYARQSKIFKDILNLVHTSGSYIIQVNLDDPSFDIWKKFLIDLGYENDIIKLSLGEAVNIPGVYYKNKNTSAVETGLSFERFRDLLHDSLANVKASIFDTDIPIDYSTKLYNMFNSVNYVTEDSKVTLTDEVFYGIPKSGDIIIDTIGATILDRLVKAGLSGGDFAKIYTIMHKAMTRTDEVNPKATNSFKALQLIEKLTDYMNGSFKVVTHTFKITDKEWEKIEAYYKTNTNSLFIPKGYLNGEIVFEYNSSFNKEAFLDSCTKTFDIRQLLPMWGNQITEQSGHSDYQTVFTIAKTLGYSIKDLYDIANKPLEILDISTTALDNSKKISGTKTIKEFIADIPEDTDNYYLLTKRAYLDSAVVFSNKFKESLLDIDNKETLIKFANRKAQTILGNLLADPEFKDIKPSNIELITKLHERFISDYNKDLNFKGKTDKFDYYFEDISSADITRLATEHSADVTIEDIKYIVDLLQVDNKFLITSDDKISLLEHNSAWSILSCINEDNRGAYISMEYYETLSKTDRTFLIDTLNKITSTQDLDNDTKIKLLKLRDTLIKKNKLLDTYERTTVKPTTIKSDVEAANAPTVQVFKSMFGDLTDKQVDTLASLVMNRKLNKTLPKRFLSSSSLDSNTTYNPLMSRYMDLINEYLYRTIDKQGHTMVYNMNSQEAIGEFFSSITGFKKLLQQSTMFKDIPDEVLYEFAMLSNVYSTGTTIDAEYSGALVLELDDNGNYSIKPVEVSSSDPDKGIYSYLLSLNTSAKKRIMITLNKNSFVRTPSGIASDIRALDLNDDTTYKTLLQNAYIKAVDGIKNSPSYSDDMTAEEILIEYYVPKYMTTQERITTITSSLKTQGISEEVAEQIFPTIAKLHVANQTSLGEDQIQAICADYVNTIRIPSEERQTIEDIILHKVTKSALSDNVKIELENSKYKLRDDIATNKETIIQCVRNLFDNNIKDKTNVYNTIKTLPLDQQQIIYKMIILQRQSGKDLNFLMNKHNLAEHSKFIRNAVLTNRNPILDYYKEPVCTYDTEWLIQGLNIKRKNKDLETLYQIGFTITRPTATGELEKESFTILIKEGLNKAVGNIKESKVSNTSENALFYIEDREAFKNKQSQKTNGNIYVVDNLDLALQKFEELTKDIKRFAGYNNKAEDSDNRWFKDFFERNGRECIDVRTDVNHKVLSRATEELAGDSLDYYREKGIISKRDDTNSTIAHDANSDVLDTIDLFFKIADNTIDTKDAYDALAKDARNFCKNIGITEEADIETFLKGIKFSQIFSQNTIENNKDLFDSVDVTNKNYKVGNTEFKEAISLYNDLLSSRHRRVLLKDVTYHLDTYISNNTPSRKSFLETVRDTQQRVNVLKVMASIFDAVTQHTTDDIDKIKSYREIVLPLLESAVRKYSNETHTEDISRTQAVEEFLSLDTITMADYILRANEYYDKEEGKFSPYIDTNLLDIALNTETISKRPIDFFINSWEVLRESEQAELPGLSSAKHSLHYLVKPVTELLGFKDTNFNPDNILGLSEDLSNLILDNLIHFYGTTEENYAKLQDIKDNPTKKINMFSKVDKALYDQAVEHVFGDNFYSAQALYTMAHEQTEGRITDDVNAETGVVYISKTLLKKAFPDLNFKTGDEFFTQVWRQPGQHKTVMHLMKVKVTDKGSLSMTRTTAKTYFNGDFDGDFYYFAKPGEQDQTLGTAIDKYLRAHTSLLDNLFKDIQLDSSTIDDTLSKVESVTSELLKDKSNDIKKLIESPDSKTLQSIKEDFISRLVSPKYNIDAKTAEAIWKDYGFRIVNFAELSNKNKNILITNNPYIKKSKTFKSNSIHYKTLLQNSSDYLHANQYSDYIDSQVVGAIAKSLKGDKVSGKAVDVLYTSYISLPEEVSLRIRQALSKDSTTVYKNLTKSIDALVTQGILDTNQSTIIKNSLGDETLYTNLNVDNVDVLVSNILNTISATQEFIMKNDDYNTSLTNSLKGIIKITEEDIKQLKLLVNQANTFLKNKITITDEDIASHPAILKKASEIINAVTTEKQRYYSIWYATSNSKASHLFKEAVLKGNIDIEERDNLVLLSNKNKVMLDGNYMGAKKIKIAIADTATHTDTILATRNNSDTIQTMYSPKNLNKLPLAKKEALFKIINSSNEKTFKGSILNSFLGIKDFDDNVDYTFFNAIDKNGHKVKNPKDLDQIAFYTKTSIRSNGNYFKLGLSTGKILKTTIGLSDISFKDKTIGYIASKNMIINPDTGLPHKLGSNAKIEIVGEETVDNVKYTIYEVDDASIIDSSVDKSLSVSDRKLDIISINQGGQGMEACLSFGKWFLTIDNDTITYDPEGYRRLLDSIDDSKKPLAEEMNGIAELNLLRIASLLKVLSDKDLLTLSTRLNMPGMSRQEILSELYNDASLGGDRGEDIISTLKSLINNDSKALNNFKKLCNENEVIGNLWGEDLEYKIQKSLRQTSQDFTDEEGNPIEAYRSKNQVPSTNARYSSMSKDINLKDTVVAYSNSAIDYTNSYIGKLDLLQTLNPNNTFTKNYLDTLYEADYIDYRKGRRGNIFNNFKFIEEGQGKYIDYDEVGNSLVDKKVGHNAPVVSFKNESTGTITGLISNSKGKRTYILNKNIIKDVLNTKAQVLRPSLHTHLDILAGDGSDESIYKSFTRAYNTDTAGLSISRPFFGITEEGDFDIKTAHYENQEQQIQTTDDGTLGIKDRIKEETKGPISATKFSEIRKNKEAIFSNLSPIIDFIHKEFSIVDRDKNMGLLLKAYKDSDNFANLEADKTFWDTLKEKNLNTEFEDTLRLVRLYGNSNDIELTKSILRSWGFKAKDNKDITLGNKVVSMGNYVQGYKSKLLDRDYDFITTTLKRNKNLNYAFNYYMEISRRLDMYKELKNNESKYRKLGDKSYESKLTMAENQLLNGFKSVEEVEQKLLSIRQNNATLNNLIKAANKIHQRLQETARMINPYTILGYSIPVYANETKLKNDNWFRSLSVDNNNKRYNNQEDALLRGTKLDANKNLISMTTLYDADTDGWVAMIQKISTDLAVDQSVRDLKQTLISDGWMRNAEIFIGSTKYFEDKFEKFVKTIDVKTKPREIDIETYRILRHLLIEFDPSTKVPSFNNLNSFVDLYRHSKDLTDSMYKSLGNKFNIHNLSDLYEALDKYRDDPIYNELKTHLKLANAHQQIIATMCSMLTESKDSKNFFKEMYAALKPNPSDGYVLVDNRGAEITNDGCFLYKDIDLDGYARELRYGKNMSQEDREATIAQMMLSGEVYQMKKSVSQQLQDKVFTKKVPGKILRLLNKTTKWTVSFIMSTPLQLIDRILNYTIYDAGVIGSASVKALSYIPTSVATIRKYMSSIDSIDELSLSKDKNLQYLIRYIAASGQSPIDSNVFRGETIDPVNLPIIKNYLKTINKTFNQQNLVARFAYYLDLVHSAEKNNGIIDSTKSGVAYHMMDEIYNIKGNAKATDAYNENNIHMANVDAQAAQIIAENLGAVGNNPYGSTTLGRMGFAFTTFPLIGARWASNRLQSLAYAFTHLDNDSSVRYLGRNLGSVVATTALLLALEVLLSEDSQEYLFEDRDEMSEEELANAENIIFRGGCVKLFESLLKDEEVTTATHNRGTEYALYDSFLKDLLERQGEDDTIWDGVGRTLKSQVWSHTPVLPKDIIESIPGNKYLQSTSWATPSDNFFDNYTRKVSGYIMGSSQANAFINSLNATQYEEDMDGWDRIAAGLQKAYVENNTNIKEYKSEYKNYKKAFSILYDYKKLISNDDWSYYDTSSEDNLYTNFKSELNNALKNKTSPAAVYNLIDKYKDNGMSLSAMLSALKNSSLTFKLNSLPNINEFMNSLSDSEAACIKTALMYEDYNYPYIDDIIEELTKKYKDSNKNSYTPYLNFPKNSSKINYNSSNSNYYRYNNTSNYIKYLNKNNYNNNTNYSPSDTYDYLMNAWKYGKSTDLYGNKYTGYTNIKGDTWTWDGDK